MDAKRVVARNMKRLREAKGWSQEAMAEHSGLHRTYVSGVERGVRNPTVSVLQKIAEGLETTMIELVRDDAEGGLNPAPARPPRDRA